MPAPRAPWDPPRDPPAMAAPSPAPALPPPLLATSEEFWAPWASSRRRRRGNVFGGSRVETHFSAGIMVSKAWEAAGRTGGNRHLQILFLPLPPIPRFLVQAFVPSPALFGGGDKTPHTPLPNYFPIPSSFLQGRHRSTTRRSKVPSTTGKGGGPREAAVAAAVTPRPLPRPPTLPFPRAGAAPTSSAASCWSLPSWATWWWASWVRTGRGRRGRCTGCRYLGAFSAIRVGLRPAGWPPPVKPRAEGRCGLLLGRMGTGGSPRGSWGLGGGLWG